MGAIYQGDGGGTGLKSDVGAGSRAETRPRGASIAGLFGDTVLYGLPRVTFMALSLVLVPIYTRYFGVAEYGLIENLNILAVGLTLVFGLGLPDAIIRFYSHADHGSERAHILSSATLAMATSGLVAVGAMTSLAGWLGPLVLHEAPSRSRYLILLVALSAALNLQLMVPQSALLVSSRRREYLTIALGSMLGSVSITVACLVSLGLGLESVFVGPVIGYGSLALYAFWRVRFDLRARAFDAPTLRRLFGYSLPLVPAALAMLVIRSSDRYFITLLMPDALYQVGLYSTAEKVMGPLTLMGAAFSVAWAPFAMAASRQEDWRSLYVSAFKLYVSLTSLCVVVLCAAAPLVLWLLTTPPYYRSLVYTPPLGIYLSLNSLYYIGSVGLLLTNKTRLLVPMVVAAALLNAGLNLLWIPRWGVNGAAWATVAALLAYNAMIYLTAERLHPVGFPLATALLVYALAGVAAHLALRGPLVAVVASVAHLLVLVGTGFLDLRALAARSRALLKDAREGLRA